jgi:hypothetical protein
MGCKLSKIGSGWNLLPFFKGADYSDNLWISCIHNLMQWSISQKKVTKDYGNIMSDSTGYNCKIIPAPRRQILQKIFYLHA